jgi:ribokinase
MTTDHTDPAAPNVSVVSETPNPVAPAARVVVVGSLNMDLVASTPWVPVPGETVIGRDFAMLPGGKGANQAVAAARAGAQVTMIGRVGPDDFGGSLASGLQAEGVDVTHVGMCKHDPTGVALISVADNGENSIVVAPGANLMMRPVHIEDAGDAGVFSGGGVLLLQLEIPLEVAVVAAKTATDAGMTVVFNPAPAQPLPDELWGLIDVLIVNETELEQLGGFDEVRPRVHHLVATMGDQGVEVYAAGVAGEAIGSLVVDVVDTTGAGDAFCGYLAAELAMGADVLAAAALANVAAGLSVTSRGARTSPTAEQVAAYLND